MIGSTAILMGILSTPLGGDVVPMAPARHGLAEIAQRIKHEDCRLTLIGDSNSLREKEPRMLGGIMRTWNPDHWAGRLAPGVNSSDSGIRINCSETGLVVTGRPVWDAATGDPSVWSNGQDGFIPTRGWDISTDGTGMARFAPYAAARLTRLDEYIGGDWTANTPMKARLVFAHDPTGMPSLRYLARRDGVSGVSVNFTPRDPDAIRPWIDWVDVDIPAGTGEVSSEVRTPVGWLHEDKGGPFPCPDNCTAGQTFFHATQVFWRTDVPGLQIDSIAEGGFTVEDHLPESGHYDDAALQGYLDATRRPNVFVILLGQNMTQEQAADIEGLWRSKMEAVIERYRAASLANDSGADPQFLLLAPWQTGNLNRFYAMANVLYEIADDRADTGFINLMAVAGSIYENRILDYIEGSSVHFLNDQGANYFTGLIWEQIERELAGEQDIVVPGDTSSLAGLVLTDDTALHIHEGSFVGPLEVTGDDVTITGWSDYESVVTDAAGLQSTLLVHTGAEVRVHRLEIQGGEGTVDSSGLRRGGAVMIDGGDVSLTDVHISGGAAMYGGGVALQQGSLTAVSSKFTGSLAAIDGGLMHVDDGEVELDGVYMRSGAAQFGGGIAVAGGSVTMVDSTLEFCEALTRGGGIVQSGGGLSIRQSYVSQCESPQDAGLWLAGGETELVSMRVSGNSAEVSAGGVGIFGGTLELAATTLCANEPDNLAGEWIDLGGNEMLPECTCGGDLDGSNDVGVDDLLIVVAAWGPCQGECLADINNDGVVSTDDILAMLAAWGPCI